MRHPKKIEPPPVPVTHALKTAVSGRNISPDVLRMFIMYYPGRKGMTPVFVVGS